jgi:hypothetical protein
MHPGHKSPVTIEGQELGAGTPLYFTSRVPRTRFDQSDSTRSPGTAPEHNWKEYPSSLFFRRAGYGLKTAWSVGGWRRVFGFGR